MQHKPTEAYLMPLCKAFIALYTELFVTPACMEVDIMIMSLCKYKIMTSQPPFSKTSAHITVKEESRVMHF